MSLYRALVTVWPFSWKCTNKGPLTSQKMVSMTFPAEARVLNFLLAGDDGCFHCIDCLTLWFIMVYPGLGSCHSSMEKSISFTTMTVQMLLTNRLPCTLVIIGQLPWDPSATHFPIPEVIMDNFVRRAVAHVEFYGSFINSDLSVVTDLLLHCLSCHANWSPLRCSSLTFCLPFWNLSTHSYTLPSLKQLSPYRTFILL